MQILVLSQSGEERGREEKKKKHAGPNIYNALGCIQVDEDLLEVSKIIPMISECREAATCATVHFVLTWAKVFSEVISLPCHLL